MNTPLTDAVMFKHSEYAGYEMVTSAIFAQELERRVNQLEADKAELVESLEIANNYLRDDLWTSGESRQSLRDVNARLITKHKDQK